MLWCWAPGDPLLHSLLWLERCCANDATTFLTVICFPPGDHTPGKPGKLGIWKCSGKIEETVLPWRIVMWFNVMRNSGFTSLRTQPSFSTCIMISLQGYSSRTDYVHTTILDGNDMVKVVWRNRCIWWGPANGDSVSRPLCGGLVACSESAPETLSHCVVIV